MVGVGDGGTVVGDGVGGGSVGVGGRGVTGGDGVGEAGTVGVGGGISATSTSGVDEVPHANIVPITTKTIAAVRLNLKYRGMWFIRSPPFVILIYLCCNDCYHLEAKWRQSTRQRRMG